MLEIPLLRSQLFVPDVELKDTPRQGLGALKSIRLYMLHAATQAVREFCVCVAIVASVMDWSQTMRNWLPNWSLYVDPSE